LYHDYWGYSKGLYYPFTGAAEPGVPKSPQTDNLRLAWARYDKAWATDPIWADLEVDAPAGPTAHMLRHNAFDNFYTGTAFGIGHQGIEPLAVEDLEWNVLRRGAAGLNGCATFQLLEWGAIPNPGVQCRNFGGALNTILSNKDHGKGDPNIQGGNARYNFRHNFLAGAVLNLGEVLGEVKHNVLSGQVMTFGWGTDGSVADNVISNPHPITHHSNKNKGWCVWSLSRSKHIANAVIHTCDRGVGTQFSDRSWSTAQDLTILNAQIGIDYFNDGYSSTGHDKRQMKYRIERVAIYSRHNGKGIGITNPTVHSSLIAESQPGGGKIAEMGPRFTTLGNSDPSMRFRSELVNVTFRGFENGVAISYVKGHIAAMGDHHHHAIVLEGVDFTGTPPARRVRSHRPFGFAMTGLCKCIQTNCDSLRSHVIIDRDGSLLGEPGTVVARGEVEFYDKLQYVDPLGAETMEDLIPYVARYDRFGKAIPMPAHPDAGSGGGLQFTCPATAATNCSVLKLAVESTAAAWAPVPDLAVAPGTVVEAVSVSGNMAQVDALLMGWRYADTWIRLADYEGDAEQPMPEKPEGQHARRYGRVGPGEFSQSELATRDQNVKGPVYTSPGIFRPGCTYDESWGMHRCPGGKHRHLIIEVMDWNHRERRWAPVTVEVNDKYAPQGGTLQVLTGPANNQKPTARLQTFTALGHVGMRHNVYFSANVPDHIRLHLLDPQEEGECVIVCVYYGVPNDVVGYVGGARKAPVTRTITWDSPEKMLKLTPDMPHGSYYYDRIGGETGRPGYLYTTVCGDRAVDFKIQPKLTLTSKVEVTASWGDWEDPKGNSFFKKGMNGLVRNIALLIGAPPSRVAIFGEGTAAKGSFWNEETTSKEFAEKMWKRNTSMSRDPELDFLQSRSTEEHADRRSLALASAREAYLSQFSEGRAAAIRAGLLHGAAVDEVDAAHVRG
jgi:hypothetical protein